ncbi:histone deacetylase [Nocardioides donggukensis]|uniref:Histone deacetylase n=1 Tax=Nocardioides donggukensis TaxID=2774019 RepID=A0A927K2P4_9ACTN|nr:histone deacetylase [Nocardioides donggukensis]MBD8868969.1 histone deacetylase [Nocardioides donggukensis]
MLVWYASYGSNLAPERFACYLEGGRPEGAARSCTGARDSTAPRDERAVVLPGSMFFGWESTTWGGGVSFLDARADDVAYARAYLVTEEQFADVAAQEMHREPGEDLDLAHVMEHRSHSVGPGHYETLHLVGELEGVPMLTFTAEQPDAIARNAPTAPYLATIVSGLRETHGLDDDEVSAYLHDRPGMDRTSRRHLAERVLG